MRISGPFLPLASLPILINRADQWPAVDTDDSTACSGAETAAHKGGSALPLQHLLSRLVWHVNKKCLHYR